MHSRVLTGRSAPRDTLEEELLSDQLQSLHAELDLLRHEALRQRGTGATAALEHGHHGGVRAGTGDASQDEAAGLGQQQEEEGKGRLIIVVTDPVFTWRSNGEVDFTERFDPLSAVADAVEAGAPGRVHWVCLAPPRPSFSHSSQEQPAQPLASGKSQDSVRLAPELHVTPVPVPEAQRILWLGEYRELLLWPCLHSLLQPTGGGGLPPFGEPGAHAAAWAATQAGTAAFARELAGMVTASDTVLVADPALLLLPEALRREMSKAEARPAEGQVHDRLAVSGTAIRPEVAAATAADLPTIVFALRTPFPSPEVWRCLPSRADLLTGLLGADLVILQSFDDARNLSAAAQHVLGLEARPSWVDVRGRFAAVSVMPLGIEPAQFDIRQPEVQRHARDMAAALGVAVPWLEQEQVGNEHTSPGDGTGQGTAGPSTAFQAPSPPKPLRLITAIDSLDMSRGLPQKLLGYEALLTQRPEYKETTQLVLVLPPDEGQPSNTDSLPAYPAASMDMGHGGPVVGGRVGSLFAAASDTYGGQAWPGPEARGMQHGHWEATVPSYGQPQSMALAPGLASASQFQTATLRRTVHELTGRINGAFGTPTWLPVRLLRGRLTAVQRAALYSLSAVGFQVSAREGLTYEALEYAAAQPGASLTVEPPAGQPPSPAQPTGQGPWLQVQEDQARAFSDIKTASPGVLLYSDFAGAASALRGALLVNPFDSASVGASLYHALSMPEDKRRARHSQVLAYVQHTAASLWAARLLVLADAAGSSARERRPAMPLPLGKLIEAYRGAASGNSRGQAQAEAHNRLLVFSYNGTLRPYATRLDAAAPSPRLRLALASLAADPCNHVWIVSGDISARRLHEWLGDLPIGLAAESGFRYRYPPPQPVASRIARGMLPSLTSEARGDVSGSPATVVVRGLSHVTPTGQVQHALSTTLEPAEPSTVAWGGLDTGTRPRDSSSSWAWTPPPPDQWHALFELDGPHGTAADSSGSTESLGDGTPGPWTVGQATAEPPSTTQLPLHTAPAASTTVPFSWYGPVKEILEFYTVRTPGSLLQEGDATLLWSYADVQPDRQFGDAVARDVLVHLDSTLFGQPAEALPAHAKRFIAVRPVGVSKGTLLARLLASPQYGRGVSTLGGQAGQAASTGSSNSHPVGSSPVGLPSPFFSFILVAGDERTDEEMYPHARALGEGKGWAIVVSPPIGPRHSPNTSSSTAGSVSSTGPPPQAPGTSATYTSDSGAPYYVQTSDALLDVIEALGQ